MLLKDNPESWQRIHKFIEKFPEDEYWSSWKPMAREIISALEARGLAAQFRMGQSMHHLIFSTLDHHGLSGEPRVTLEFDPKTQQVRVAYSRANLWFNAADSEERVGLPLAVPCVIGYLRRLWSETKPDSQIPDALKTV
jgi:hypothetical protein